MFFLNLFVFFCINYALYWASSFLGDYLLGKGAATHLKGVILFFVMCLTFGISAVALFKSIFGGGLIFENIVEVFLILLKL